MNHPPNMPAFAGLPAAVNQAVKPAGAKRKTGLLPMVAGSRHQITIKIAGQATHVVQTTAQHPDAVRAAMHDVEHPVLCVCLHHACAGRAWADERAMRSDHGTPSAMEKQAPHVWGLWSNRPADPEAERKARAAVAAVERKLEAAKDESAREKLTAELEAARAAHASASAVVGLIAPPEAKGEEA